MVLVLLIAVMAFNTWRYQPVSQPVSEVDLPVVDVDDLAAKLSKAVTFKTISRRSFPDGRPADFQEFVDWLEAAFPSATAAMERVLINELTPLYVWKGTCLLYTSPSPRDKRQSRMPSSA